MANRVPPVTFRNCKVIFKNFSGRPDKYNPRGGEDNRNFSVIIPDNDLAQEMLNDGWNIRMLRPRDDEEQAVPYLKVKVNYEGKYPPNIYMISGHRKTRLDQESVGELDYSRFVKCDLKISPNTYIDSKTGEERLSAYVRDMYVTVEIDELAEEYADYE